MKKKKILRLISAIFLILLIIIYIIPQMYRNYHSAPYCYSSGTQITLEDTNTHKLNKFQKQQFTKMAKKIIDSEDGPFDWNNYKKVSLSVYKMKKRSEYGLIYRIRPNIHERVITNSIIVKLKDRSLKDTPKVTVIDYSSDFSNILSVKH